MPLCTATLRPQPTGLMKNLSTFLLLALAGSFGCADGCGCGGSQAAPVVPESAGAPSDFDPATSGTTPAVASPNAPAAAAPIRVEQPTALGEEPEPAAEGSGGLNIRATRFDVDNPMGRVNPPTLQIQPITPGQGGRLPNRVSPDISNPRLRQVGPTAGSVDPEFIVNE